MGAITENIEKPLVSVLMTAYNREKYISEAIESVVNSAYQNWELIIIDDCSKDKTVEIARSYEEKDRRIKVYVNEKNLGDYPNRNMAAGYARGKYIKYLDSDDLMYPHTLDVMVLAMEQFPDAALGIITRQGQYHIPFSFTLSPVEVYRNSYLKRNSFIESGPSATVIKRDIFDELGGFSGKRFIGDKEMWLKLTQQNPLVCLPPGLIWWRQHENQEYDIGMKTNQYINMAYDVNIEALRDKKCPLSEQERLSAIQHMRTKYSRLAISFLRRGKFLKAREQFNYYLKCSFELKNK